MKADLHIHSVFSDGSDSREIILQKAAAVGIKVLAFTEHDITEGWQESLALGRRYGITVLPGVEISACDAETGKKVHILGYGFKSADAINALCRPVAKARHENSLQKIKVLQKLGYKITEADVLPYAHKYIFKKHIVRYLFESGQEDKIFGNVYHKIFHGGGPGDFGIKYVNAADAVKVITESGGKAVLAHPGQQNNFEILPELKRAGLWGIELRHPVHNACWQKIVLQAAADYGLYCTGGSDCHGIYSEKYHAVGSNLCPAAAAEELLKQNKNS